MGYFRVMGAMAMGNVGKAVVLMIRMGRDTYLSSLHVLKCLQ